MGQLSAHDQKIIIREWRHCQEDDYAVALLELVACEPLGLRALSPLLVGGAGYGGMAGLWIGLILTNYPLPTPQWEFHWIPLAVFIALGMLLGCGISWGVWMIWGRLLSWQKGLSVLLEDLQPTQLFSGLLTGLLVGGVCGLSFGAGCWTGVLIVGLLLGLVIGDLWIGLTIGGGLGLVVWLGGPLWLGIILSGTTTTGLLAVVSVGWLFTLTAAAGLGLGFAWGFGPVAGVFTGVLGGLISIFAFFRKTEASISQLSERRRLCFWWWQIPTLLEVRKSLENISPLSNRLFQKADQKSLTGEIPPLLKMLSSTNWQERFIARHALTQIGGKAIPPLVLLVDQASPSLLREIRRIVKGILSETASRLSTIAAEPDHFVCPFHPYRPGLLEIRSSRLGLVKFFACRFCAQTERFLRHQGPIVAVLDETCPRPIELKDGQLRVNWLIRKDRTRWLFDFDWVEVIQAADLEVQRFCMDIEADPDPVRRSRYKTMLCRVWASVELWPNTWNRLRAVFGRVERVLETSGCHPEQKGARGSGLP
ncbi:MAG: hypothetical protein NZ602_10630 [Thermoguttaceae bacterium]|nr:hypothetical protein [Thermoguttaceae bacterium]MDW8038954.1 hypothetical protein [Thermoguttaceae bacterium]